MYVYKAKVVRCWDADTVHCDIDLGFGIWTHSTSLRLLGVQAPELGSTAGRDAKWFLQGLLPTGTDVVVHTVRDKREKYGRLLADVFKGDLHLNKHLIDSGHAVEWNGRGARPSL